MLHRDEPFFIIDISGSGVSFSYGRYRSGRPHVLGAHTESMPTVATISMQKLYENVISAHARGWMKLFTSGSFADADHPASIDIFFASPFHAGVMQCTSHSFSAPSKIDSRFISEIVSDARTRAIEGVKNLAGKDRGEGYELIESRALSLVVNGYTVDRLPVSGAKSASVGVFASALSSAFFAALKMEIRRHLPRANVRTHTRFTSVLDYARAVVPDRSYLLLLIDAESTEISLMINGISVAYHAFPTGAHAIDRVLLERGVATSENMRSILALYRSGGLSEIAKSRVSASIAEASGYWLQGFEYIAGHLFEDWIIPRRVYMVGEGTWGGEYSSALSLLSLDQYAFTHQPFDVKPLPLDPLPLLIERAPAIPTIPLRDIETHFISHIL